MRFYHSLRFRIILCIVTVLVFVMGGFSYLFHDYYRHRMLNNLRNSTMQLSETVIGALELAMIGRERDKMQKMIERMESEKKIKRIFILNKNGEIRISSRPDEIGTSIPKDDPTCQICHRRAPSNRSKTVELRLNREEQILRSASPIANQRQCYGSNCHEAKDKINGMLILDYSLQEMNNQLATIGKEMTLAVGVGVLTIIVILGVLMNKIVLAKLTHFLKATKEIGGGDLRQRIRLKSRDEIGMLAISFNEMTQNLRNSMQQISQAKDYLENLINSIEDGILVVDKEHKIVMANNAALVDKQYSKEDVIGKYCYQLPGICLGTGTDNLEHACQKPPYSCPVRETFLTGRFAKALHTYPDAGGKHRYVEIYSSPLKDESKEVIQAIEVRRDITQRKELESLLIRSERLALVGRLAAGVAHEINNPMASITACVEGLLRRSQQVNFEAYKGLEKFPKYLATVREAAYRCKEITSRLLGFCRENHLVKEPVNVNKVINQVLSLVEYEADLDNKVIIRDFSDNLPLIQADRLQLSQLFLNLILNALDAIEEAGEVIITTQQRNENIELSFEDTGSGIPKEDLSRIFEPFFTTKPADKGTGLGLSICENIINKHGGTIRVDSQLGVGTIFHITLPIKGENEKTRHKFRDA